MCSGKPPTLWCDLILAETVLSVVSLSMTSGVERALRQKVNCSDAGGLLVEDADEFLAYNLALLFRVDDASESAEEVFGCVGVDEISLKVPVEGVAYCLRLALAHHAVVDENAGEAVADRALNQCCRNPPNPRHRRGRR